MISVFDKLDSVLHRYQEIEESMATPEVAVDFEQVQQLAKERATLEGLVDISRRHQVLSRERDSLEELLREETDQEITQMANKEQAGKRSDVLSLFPTFVWETRLAPNRKAGLAAMDKVETPDEARKRLRNGSEMPAHYVPTPATGRDNVERVESPYVKD